MLKLLIVDDEKTTRDSLRDLIPWNEMGITEVVVAKNGNEALETARRVEPDIIISDIRMPKMDGLELARHLRHLFPDCKIIFLSGYADKDYLKSAIQLKAVSYIEKPINPDEIKAVIRETVSHCNTESERVHALARLKSTVRGSQPLVRQEITLELIKGSVGIANLAEKYGDLPFLISPASGYTVAYIPIRWQGNLEPKDIDHYQQILIKILSSETLTDPDHFTAGFDSGGNIVFISAWKTDTAASDRAASDTAASGSQDLWQRLFDQLNEHSKGAFSFAVGIGESVADITHIPASYQTALLAANRQFYDGLNRIYDDSDSFHSRPAAIDSALVRNLFATFKEALQKDEPPHAQNIICNLTGQIRSCHDSDTNRVKNIYFHLLLLIFEVALERGLIDPFSPTEKNYIWKEIEEKRSLDELSEYVAFCVQSIFGRVNETDAVNRKAYEIMCFIRDNYGDKELSVQSIAGRVYLSPTYLCAFYKKATGKTLNEFITATRMEKSKEMLADRRIKLYEIATKVGFTDVNYFSTLFKRYVGCTPSEFREKHCR